MSDVLYVRLEKEAYEWLKKLLDNSMAADPNSHVKQTAFAKLESAFKSFSEPITIQDIVKSDEVQNQINELVDKKTATVKARVTQKKASTRNKRKKKVDVDPYVCPDHPMYKVVRAPRTGCDKCWELYKTFHPLEYTNKRRAFERNQKNK